ncbi:DUF6350 family protein [Streptomyces sp.]|uniref:cell division protein PerM n=1 Tax=Streptomyces sp. TaxID=1931 RepID=UPI002F3F0515
MTDTTDGTVPAFRTEGASFQDQAAPFQGEGAGHARWGAARVSGLAAGAVAAGLGLGMPVAVVLLLWIASPFPDGGLDGALHLGAGLWLLAHGAELVRTGTLSGDSAPIAVTPLLLSALPAWLLHRGTASAVAAEEAADAREAAVVAGRVLAGYLGVAAIAVAYAMTGPAHVRPLTALYVPFFAAAVVGCGAWSGRGRPLVESSGHREEAAAALRFAGIGTGLLLGGGALLGAVSLGWHAGASGSTYAQLGGGVSGRLAVLLLAVALVPNLAVWGASYSLGAGFSVGVGTSVAPAGASGHPPLPDFPLLAAVPGPGGGVGWAALAVPAVAGGALAWCAGRAGWDVRRTLRVTCASALCSGAGFAVLASWSGGPLGTGLLAEFGPTWWRAGGLAAGWVLAVGLPGALILRRTAPPPSVPSPSWRTLARSLRPAPPPEP